jgi:Mg-chelatase subunit ChlD
MVKKRKKGLSEVISVILFILLALALIITISMVVVHKINTTKEEVEVLNVLGMENANIEKAVGDFKNGGEINITIRRTFSNAEKSTSKSSQIIQENKPVDIILVLDRSGSMRQSGWILETNLSANSTTNLVVPGGAYSSTYSFSVPSGTTRLAVAINWSKVAGFNGSEGSEFAMNLKRPSGSWIANSGNYPDELSGKVDPPDSIGTALEYFSGISTKPQYFYIENPQNGTWQVKVYGWNLRPKSAPPASQNVSVKIYIGNYSTINKSSTAISSDLVKAASKSFVDRLKEGDRAAIVRFGSYAELTQNLTSNKTLVKNAIDNIGSEGGTAINTGISTATQNLISSGNPNSLKIITILTDGQNDAGPNPVIASIQQAKDLNYTIFTIGMTNFVDEATLKTIATKPEYYYYSDFNMLDEIYQQLSEKIISISQTKTVGISFIILFLNDKSSCQKEIDASELPELVNLKTFNFNLEGCIKNITKIEIHSKIKNTIGPTIDSITVSS